MKRILVLLAVSALAGLGLAAPAHAVDAATGSVTITNNGSYSRTYSAVSYTCGTDREVLFTAHEQAGLTGSNDDGDVYSTIDGSINPVTGIMNWKFTRDSYTASFSGSGTYSAGTFSFTQDDTLATPTGGVTGAAGTFSNVPSCAVVPPVVADTCKDGGWKVNSHGPFRNQGQCVSAYARGIYAVPTA